MTTLSLKRSGGEARESRQVRVLTPPQPTINNTALRVNPKPQPLGELVPGVVVWFHNNFGFLRRVGGGDGDRDYFAHKNEFEIGYLPKANDRVMFYAVVESRKFVAKQISQRKIESVPVISSDSFL